MMGVHVVVPTEHAVDDGEEEGSSFGGVIGWFTASTRGESDLLSVQMCQSTFDNTIQ